MSSIKFTVRKQFHLLLCKTRNWEASYEFASHYRLVFVTGGDGQFILNYEMHNYCQGGVILLKPDEMPVFQEDISTEVLVIAFNSPARADVAENHMSEFAETYKQVENIFKNLRVRQGKPVSNERDADTIRYLVEQITFELTQQQALFLKLIKGSVALIVNTLARNNFEFRKAEEPEAQLKLSEALVEHLKNELRNGKTIRVPELLMKFNISEEAANLCMLNSTGMSLRNFIFKYKTDLFKSRTLKMDVSAPLLPRSF
ncbi:hypothetical protein [Dyadobacter sp. CY347]|uniref:hypothetical protein n=1 Tax=Dyadobacter sp. CY347 TaxID=2909336 RepID=UPI001F38FA11|nr:hypothetical protein [Dyadobacter sp. CY347]MCF2489163.1 hypothetical protein [Dyadobacter sp. CY347]